MHDTDPWLYYTYDDLGNRTQTVDETCAFGRSFDELNRLITKQTKADTVYHLYDKSSMRTQVGPLDGAGG